jgi:hypothetical protein
MLFWFISLFSIVFLSGHTSFLLCSAEQTSGTTTTVVPTVRAQDFVALQDLYDATHGDAWIWLHPYNVTNGYPWNFTDPFYSNPCNTTYPWQGVSCTINNASETVVTKLKLSGYNMEGNIIFHIVLFHIDQYISYIL